MTRKIKAIIKEELIRIGLSKEIDCNKLWEEPIFYYEPDDSSVFLTWKVTYYPVNQADGSCHFSVRFSKENTYLNYVPDNLNDKELGIEIVLY